MERLQLQKAFTAVVNHGEGTIIAEVILKGPASFAVLAEASIAVVRLGQRCCFLALAAGIPELKEAPCT